MELYEFRKYIDADLYSFLDIVTNQIVFMKVIRDHGYDIRFYERTLKRIVRIDFVFPCNAQKLNSLIPGALYSSDQIGLIIEEHDPFYWDICIKSMTKLEFKQAIASIYHYITNLGFVHYDFNCSDDLGINKRGRIIYTGIGKLIHRSRLVLKPPWNVKRFIREGLNKYDSF